MSDFWIDRGCFSFNPPGHTSKLLVGSQSFHFRTIWKQGRRHKDFPSLVLINISHFFSFFGESPHVITKYGDTKYGDPHNIPTRNHQVFVSGEVSFSAPILIKIIPWGMKTKSSSAGSWPSSIRPKRMAWTTEPKCGCVDCGWAFYRLGEKRIGIIMNVEIIWDNHTFINGYSWDVWYCFFGYSWDTYEYTIFN